METKSKVRRGKTSKRSEKTVQQTSLTAEQEEIFSLIDLSYSFDGFYATVRHIRFSDNSGQGNSKKRNMCNGIKIFYGFAIMNPKSFLPGSFKPRVISLTFGSERVNRFKRFRISINGKPVIIRYSDVFIATTILFTIIPIFMIAWTCIGFTTFKRATEFLPCTPFAPGFTALVHC